MYLKHKTGSGPAAGAKTLEKSEEKEEVEGGKRKTGVAIAVGGRRRLRQAKLFERTELSYICVCIKPHPGVVSLLYYQRRTVKIAEPASGTALKFKLCPSKFVAAGE